MEVWAPAHLIDLVLELRYHTAQDGVFWPRDLLPGEDCCKKARIMTYGYDSEVLKFADTANFSTITSQGETLLNGLARVRSQDHKRPLMLVVHSLGGLVIKAVKSPFTR